MCVQLSFWVLSLNFFVYVPKTDIARLYSKSMFNFLSNHHGIFHSGCIILLSHQQGTKILLFPQPHLYFLCSALKNKQTNKLPPYCVWRGILLWFWFSFPASLVAQRLKHLPPMRETWVRSLGQEDPLEEKMATHSSTLARRIPWREEPGSLQSMGSQGVRHDWATSLHFFTD